MMIKCAQLKSDVFNNHSILKNHIELLGYAKRTFNDEDNIYIIKVPGRVNLIGEHVDYNNGPVLPCAIDREIIICMVTNSSGLVRISNVNPAYDPIEFSAIEEIKPYKRGHWGNYIKAGIKGIVDYLRQTGGADLQNIKGLDARISSTLPPAAGLSSSSTLVVGAALALLKSNNLQMDHLTMAEICAEAEHFVGTSGGGMDHAAILLGKKDSFTKLDFNPLRSESILAPSDLEIILFNSMIEAEKSSYVREAYNQRVLECNFALNLFNLYLSDHHKFTGKPFKFIGDISAESMKLDQSDLDILIAEFLESLSASYALQELLSLFNTTENELSKQYQHILRGAELNNLSGGYNLKNRFKHVYTECIRVNQAVDCLASDDKTGLGELMDASHQSLSVDYEVSTPEIDDIVKKLKNDGALGARLVGAGFGGMILAVTDKSQTDNLIENMRNDFYSNQSEEQLFTSIIRCEPANGAGLIQT